MPIELTKEQIYDIKRFMAFILRHKPYFYKIRLDDDGFASLDSVLMAVRKNKKLDVSKDQLIEIVKKFSGGIFLIQNDKIKARSGHTVIYNMRTPADFIETADIPNLLYFYIDKVDVPKIIFDGGITLSGKEIYMISKSIVAPTGKNEVTVSAGKARANGVKFYYHKDRDLYFTHHLSSKFVSIHV
jgi:putative RNA 2'-phosphotransferase